MGEENSLKYLTLEYWVDDNWFIGRLKEIPGVFSQGETLEELEESIRDAYQLMLDDELDVVPHADVMTKEIAV
jgi:predicted RNase H-like HicB family nuclease